MISTAAASTWAKIPLAALLRADATVLVKSRLPLALSTLMPLLILVLTDSRKAEQQFGSALVLLGLAIAYGLIATSIMGYALTVARDREAGVFQRLRVTPAPAWTIMASRLAVQMVANLIIAIVILVIGARMHHVSLSIGQYALVLLVSIAGSAVFLAIGQALVGVVRSADAVNAAGRGLFLILAFVGVFSLSGSLGSTMDTIAQWMPVGAVMTLFSGVLDLAAWNGRDLAALVACAGYIAFGTAVGIRWFRWDAR